VGSVKIYQKQNNIRQMHQN